MEGFKPAFLPNLCLFPLCHFAGVAKRDIFWSIPRDRGDIPVLFDQISLGSA